jgi:hypothetical protein
MILLIEEYKIAQDNGHKLSMDLYRDRIRKHIQRKGLKKEDVKPEIMEQLEELDLCEEKDWARDKNTLVVSGMFFSQLRECPCINPKSTCIYHKEPGTNKCFRPEGICKEYQDWVKKYQRKLK